MKLVLAKQCRIISKDDFSYSVKAGVRRKSRCCVIYLVSRETEEVFFPRAGFIVSKKVGNAVVRNLIKRRLRSIVAEFYRNRELSPMTFDVVVRALPFSVYCSYEEMRATIHGFLDEFI